MAQVFHAEHFDTEVARVIQVIDWDSPEGGAQGQGLPAAADGPLAPRPPAPTPRVLIPTVQAWQHPYVSTPAASSLAPSLKTLMLKGEP